MEVPHWLELSTSVFLEWRRIWETDWWEISTSVLLEWKSLTVAIMKHFIAKLMATKIFLSCIFCFWILYLILVPYLSSYFFLCCTIMLSRKDPNAKKICSQFKYGLEGAGPIAV